MWCSFSPCYCGYLSSLRIPFHSAKQPQHVPHLFKNASLLKEPSFSSSFSSVTNPTLSSPVSRLHPCPASNCGPIQSQKATESITAFADGLASPTLKRKKKKKKRRHSELENPTAELPAETEQDMPELTAEMREVKKCKKRKRAEEPNSVKVQREGVPSGQDEDWCLGEMWRINPDGSSERTKQQPHLTTEQKPSQTQKQIQPVLCETPQSHHDSTVKKKKKKKHKEKLDENIKHERLVVFSTFSTVIPNSFISLTSVIRLLDTTISWPSPLYRKTEMMHIDTESLDLSVSKKKAKRRKREAHQREAEDAHGYGAGDESLGQTSHVVLEKTCKPSTGTDGSFVYSSHKYSIVSHNLFAFTCFYVNLCGI